MDGLFILFTLFAAFVQGTAGSYIMKSKGRSEGAGFALGFFLGAIGLLIVLCLEMRHATRRDNGAFPPGSRPKAPAPKPRDPLPPTLTYPNTTGRHWL